jgi:cytosolic iron-sulfur protein assembly protein CIAO1
MAPHIKLLSTLNPPSSARTWQSEAHPDLPLVATASSDKTVRIYSLTSFTLLSTISGGHKRSVRAVAWKPGTHKGEAVLATGSFDASAGIWKKHYSSSGVGQDEGGIGGLGGGNDGDGDDDDDDYAFTVLLDGHESEIKSLAFSSSSRFLATCSRDKSVWIWEELEDDNWETVAVLQEHDADVKCVAWHPSEDLLASGSYDDTIRIYKEDVDDWVQVAVLSGHEQTVWWVEFEDADLPGLNFQDPSLSESQRNFLIERKGSGPRIMSCSDDLSIRVWHRQEDDPDGPATRNSGIPSIIRSHSVDQEWIQEAALPRGHNRSIYSISWSRRTGLVVSAGSDGKIIIYKEVWKDKIVAAAEHADVSDVNGTDSAVESTDNSNLTEWSIVAEIDGAHDVFEINHVCWARRWDKGRRREDEEVIISTGDDGEVKIWTLEYD